MNDSVPDFDTTLAERFRSEHTHMPTEPFVTATLERVAAERARAKVVGYIRQAALLVALIWASPWLIAASSWLSAALDGLFASVSRLVGTPIGMGIAALGITLSAALLRLRTGR